MRDEGTWIQALLLHVPDYLMTIHSAVLSATNMNPIIFAIGGFEDELVEVGVVLDEIHPAFCFIEVGMPTVVLPIGIRRNWQF